MARAPRKSELPTKTCATCGRPFSWRRKWAKDWESVRYCSERCRRDRRNGAAPLVAEAVIVRRVSRPALGALLAALVLIAPASAAGAGRDVTSLERRLGAGVRVAEHEATGKVRFAGAPRAGRSGDRPA